jgi:hypothetical protein
VLPHHKNAYQHGKPAIEVTVPKPLADILTKYMGHVHAQLTKESGSKLLFVNDKGQEFSEAGLTHWFKRMQENFTAAWQHPPTLTPGKLRSIYATSVRDHMAVDTPNIEIGGVLIMGTSSRMWDKHYDKSFESRSIQQSVELTATWKERVLQHAS